MRKKLFAILMSAMMMVTFMPTMAFAGEANEHEFPAYNECTIASNGEMTYNGKVVGQVTKFATCTTEGSYTVKCVKTKEAVPCDATFTDVIPYAHNFTGVKPVKYTMKEIADAYVAAGLKTRAQADYWLLGQTANCGKNVVLCKDCGAIKLTYDENGKATDIFFAGTEGHNPKAVAACATKTVCQDCGATLTHTHTVTHSPVVTVDENNKATIADQNSISSGLTYSNLTYKQAANCGYGALYTAVCDKCGETVTAEVGNATGSHNFGEAVELPEGMSDESHAGYVKATGKTKTVPKWNSTTSAWEAEVIQLYYKATAQNSTGYYVACSVCGKKLYNGETEPVADITADNHVHTWGDAVTVPATCTDGGYTTQFCTVCGSENTAARKADGNDALGHSYVVTTVAATCVADGYYVVKCDRCKTTISTIPGDFVAADTGYVYYTAGGTLKEDKRIKTAEAKAKSTTGHVYGSYEKFADATCKLPEVWAKKCTVCGKFNIHEGVEFHGQALGHDMKTVTFAPSCELDGYSIDYCARCGKEPVREAAVPAAGYNKVKALGGTCDMAGTMQVVKAATIFEEGIKASTCSKCGVVNAHPHTATIAKKSYAAPKVKAGKKYVKVTVADKGADTYKIYVGSKCKKTVTKAGTYKISKLTKGTKKIKIVALKGTLKATSKVKKAKVK